MLNTRYANSVSPINIGPIALYVCFHAHESCVFISTSTLNSLW